MTGKLSIIATVVFSIVIQCNMHTFNMLNTYSFLCTLIYSYNADDRKITKQI